MKKLLCVFLLCCTSAWAATTVTGNVQDLSGFKAIGGVQYADSFTGSDCGDQTNHAIRALPAAPVGGTVYLPSGGCSFATGITIDRPVILRGMAGGYNGRGTLLTYTGSGTAIFIESNTGPGDASATLLTDFTLTNAGTGTIGIDIDSGAYTVKLENVHISAGSAAFSMAAIRIGNGTTGGSANYVSIYRCSIVNQAIAIQALRAVEVRVIETDVAGSTTNAVQIGDATHKIWSFSSIGSSYGAPAANTTEVSILNGENVLFSGGSIEEDGTGYAIDIPSTASFVKNLTVDTVRIHGGSSSSQNASTYMFDVNLAGATITLKNIYGSATSSVWSNPHYFVRNQSSARVNVGGLGSDSTGATIATSNTNLFVTEPSVLNGVITYARFQELTGQLGINMLPITTLELNEAGTGPAILGLARGTVLKSQLCLEGTAGHCLNGSSQDDTSIISSGFNINVGTSGSNAFFRFTSGNRIVLGGGISTAAPPTGNTGFQHIRVAGCQTGAAQFNTCDTGVNWTSAFADTNYTATCSGDVVTSGVPQLEGIDISAAKQAGSITVRTIALTAAAAQFTTIDCIAVHD